jgi:hypothetical protein
MKKTGLYIEKDKFFEIWLIRTLKEIRQGIYHSWKSFDADK